MEESVLNKKPQKIYTRKTRVYILVPIISFLVFYYFFVSSPFSSTSTLIHVSPKEPFHDLSGELKDKNVIRSEFMLKIFFSLLGNSKQMSIGDYFFGKGYSVLRVAYMLSNGIHNISPIKVTFPEGSTNSQMSLLLDGNIVDFNKAEFDQKIANKQGYLFPDTYFFYRLTTIDEIVDQLSSNFNRKMSLLKPEIKASGKSLDDVIIMASIVNKESFGENDAPIISGILWKRISMGMPLQVDVARETYINKGLPNHPIGNPGLVYIKATIHPISSPYLYYLHDRNGVAHFARTFEEHKQNINRYLK